MPADIALAAKVADVLAAQNFGRPFTAEMLLIPDWDERKELPALQLAVIPGLQPSLSSHERGNRPLQRWSVDIVVCQRLSSRTTSEFTGLLDFVDAALGYLFPLSGNPLRITAADGHVWKCDGWQAKIRYAPGDISREKQGADTTYTGDFFSATEVFWRNLT